MLQGDTQVTWMVSSAPPSAAVGVGRNSLLPEPTACSWQLAADMGRVVLRLSAGYWSG